MLFWGAKDPSEILDYDIDWAARLAGDTIVSSTWSFVDTDGALVINSNSFLATLTKVFVSVGTLNYSYVLQNTVTTANGDTEIERVTLPVIKR